MRRALAFLLLGLAVLSPASEALSPAGYRECLVRIAAAVTAGDRVAAQGLAAGLAGQQVAWPGGALPVDPSLAGVVAGASPATAQMRLAALIAVLDLHRRSPAETLAAAVDQPALARLRQEQDEARLRLRWGGSIDDPSLPVPELPASLAERLSAAWDWLASCWRDLLDWVRNWLRGMIKDQDGEPSELLVPMTLALVGLVVVVAVVLAVFGWRRRPPPPAAIPAATPAQDADPRSRPADGWRRHAAALAAAGHYREAVRAWYHALLAACWEGGLIHHRIGRTNWEYAHALAAVLAWRGRFHALTRRFDAVWYGGQVDAAEAGDFAEEAQALLVAIDASAPGGG